MAIERNALSGKSFSERQLQKCYVFTTLPFSLLTAYSNICG